MFLDLSCVHHGVWVFLFSRKKTPHGCDFHRPVSTFEC
uniref:Uncharacterized protein n=1 Tax=Anguilla anguilla TaxID=7936 RepID=A0A0E9TYB1_ANGAN